MAPQDILKEWALTYLQTKIAFWGKDVSIEQERDALLVAGHGRYILLPSLEQIERLYDSIDDNKFFIVTFNTKENLNFLISSWEKIKEFPTLCILFVNPNGRGEKKWAIFPHAHTRITEKAALKHGLAALSQQVDLWNG